MRTLYRLGSVVVTLALAPVALTSQDARTTEKPARHVWIDFDEDGLPDLYSMGAGREDALLHNLGDGSFVNATLEAGLRGNTSSSAHTADYDKDTHTDLLLITAEGGLRLFKAAGSTFQEVTTEAGLSGVSTASRVEWIDYDRDGWVDLQLEGAGGLPRFLHNERGHSFESVVLGLPVAAPAMETAVVETGGPSRGRVAGSAIDQGGPMTDGVGGGKVSRSRTKPTRSRNAVPRDPGIVGRKHLLDSNPLQPLSIVPPIVLACSNRLRDQSGGCLLADSTATLGRLYPMSMELNVTSNNVNIGNTDATGFDLNVTSGAFSNEGGVKAAGINAPTNGYLGTVGSTDFDGILSADWLGFELGVAGISTGGSSTDNYGVMGHSNHVGVRGEHSTSPSTDYAELGRSGVGLTASGSILAGDFNGSVDIDGASFTVDPLVADQLDVDFGYTAATKGNFSVGGDGAGVQGVVIIDRQGGSDGVLIRFRKDGTTQGTIAVAAGVVSYNAFTGSHYGWADEVLERGTLVSMTGDNRRLENRAESEPIYGIRPVERRNDPAVLGVHLTVETPQDPPSISNPHLVTAVGNGDLWVVDTGVDLKPGDLLISSDVRGHGMLDLSTLERSHIVARVAEPVDWATVHETVVDAEGIERRHTRISVFLDPFVIERQ